MSGLEPVTASPPNPLRQADPRRLQEIAQAGSPRAGQGIPEAEMPPWRTVDYEESEHPRGEHGWWTFAGGPHGESYQKVADKAVKLWLADHPRVKAETVALRRDLDQAMKEAEKYTDQKDWYEDHRPLAKELFGKDEPVFAKLNARLLAVQRRA